MLLGLLSCDCFSAFLHLGSPLEYVPTAPACHMKVTPTYTRQIALGASVSCPGCIPPSACQHRVQYRSVISTHKHKLPQLLYPPTNMQRSRCERVSTFIIIERDQNLIQPEFSKSLVKAGF